MKTVDDIVTEFESLYDSKAKDLSDSIINAMENRNDIKGVVDDALKDTSFTDSIKDEIINSVIASALIGNSKLSDDDVRDAILNISWTSDKVTLNNRLDYIFKSLGINITDKATSSKLNANLILKMLQDKEKSLSDLVMIQARLNSIFNDVGYPDELDSVDDIIVSMRLNILQNKDNTDNEDKLDSMFSGLVFLAMSAGVMSAISHTMKYNTMRVVRTESNRSYYDGIVNSTNGISSVFGYRWKLSPVHSKFPFDICDVNANANVGYGKGVYPKRRMPRFPAHPHCRCHLEVVYKYEVKDEKVKFNKSGVNDYINKLSGDRAKRLFTNSNFEKYKVTGDWEKTLSAWDGYTIANSRFN